MATFYVTENQVSGDRTTRSTALSTRHDGFKETGQMLFAEANILLDGTEAAADLFRLFELDAGTQIFPQLSYIFTTVATATTATLDIGDQDTAVVADRYTNGTNIAATGTDVFTLGAAALVPYTLLTRSWITATLATLLTPVAGGAIKIRVAYIAGK
jgi:hypothetical protein